MRAFTVPKGAPSFSEIWVCVSPAKKASSIASRCPSPSFVDGRAHPLAVVATREHVIRALRWSRVRALVRLTGRGLDKTGSSLPGAQAIDRLMSRNHHRPGKEAAPCRIVGCGPFPHLNERFLEDVLRFLLIMQDGMDHREKAGRKPAIESGESLLVAGLHLPHQFGVGFARHDASRAGRLCLARWILMNNWKVASPSPSEPDGEIRCRQGVLPFTSHPRRARSHGRCMPSRSARFGD